MLKDMFKNICVCINMQLWEIKFMVSITALGRGLEKYLFLQNKQSSKTMKRMFGPHLSTMKYKQCVLDEILSIQVYFRGHEAHSTLHTHYHSKCFCYRLLMERNVK